MALSKYVGGVWHVKKPTKHLAPSRKHEVLHMQGSFVPHNILACSNVAEADHCTSNLSDTTRNFLPCTKQLCCSNSCTQQSCLMYRGLKKWCINGYQLTSTLAVLHEHCFNEALQSGTGCGSVWVVTMSNTCLFRQSSRSKHGQVCTWKHKSTSHCSYTLYTRAYMVRCTNLHPYISTTSTYL